MATRRALGWLAILCCALTVLGAIAVVAADDPPPPPLTEIEALKVQNLNLERVIIERSMRDWQEKQAKLKDAIETARPGWTWAPDTGQFSKKPPVGK